jgi:hypothetical protein
MEKLRLQYTSTERSLLDLSKKAKQNEMERSKSQFSLEDELLSLQAQLEAARNSSLNLTNELKSKGKLVNSLEQELESVGLTLEKTVKEYTTKITHLETIHEKRIKEIEILVRSEFRGKLDDELSDIKQSMDEEKARLKKQLNFAHVEIERLKELLRVREQEYLKKLQSGAYLSVDEEDDRRTGRHTQINIAAKNDDPDQEALEAGMLLSAQESKYGTNMFDAIKPEDEIHIEQYMSQNFTRTEAIQMIFEDRFGKVEDEDGNIIRNLASLPTVAHRSVAESAGSMHTKARSGDGYSPTRKLASSVLTHHSSGMHSATNSKGIAEQWHNRAGSSKEEETEINQIMAARGYDRKQAMQILQNKQHRTSSSSHQSSTGHHSSSSTSSSSHQTTHQSISTSSSNTSRDYSFPSTTNTSRVSNMPNAAGGKTLIRVGSSTELLEKQGEIGRGMR